FETRYFSVITDADGNYIDSDNEHIAAVSDAEAAEMYQSVVDGNKSKGVLTLSDRVFLYQVKEISSKEPGENNDYRLILFMDCSNRFHRIRSMLTFSILIGAGCLLMFVLLISVFSRRAVRPFAENYEKQKQFITNAGHELKTPLAIISANTEVIETLHENSEWTQSIRHQVDRLTGLVNDLITIARLDESAERRDAVMTAVDLSVLMQNAAADFRTLAEQQQKSFETDIAPSVSVCGNEKTLKELISILLDNAVKYCDDGGSIRAELKQQKHSVSLTVSNTHSEPTDCTRFFDRFYRGDTSHNSEKSGYGIGLSMADTIVRLHKGKITAQQKEQRVSFTATLPN
nr:HAMP domain-containing histidine kinase [Oscillospiraceae bacterium]